MKSYPLFSSFKIMNESEYFSVFTPCLYFLSSQVVFCFLIDLLQLFDH